MHKIRHRCFDRIDHEREKHLGIRRPGAHPFSEPSRNAYVEGYPIDAKPVRLRMLRGNGNYQPLTAYPPGAAEPRAGRIQMGQA